MVGITGKPTPRFIPKFQKHELMKTSRKILIGVSIVVTALLVTSLIVIRNDIETFFAKSALEEKYKSVSVENFQRLDFSANWVVTIKNAGVYKLELAVDDSTALKPVVKNVNGTLYFSIDSVQSKQHTGTIKARITTPTLKAIRSVSGTHIHLRDFQADSLFIDIDDGCVFTGTDNDFKHLSFRSSGDVRIELTQTPDF
jgi:hypothetical protein